MVICVLWTLEGSGKVSWEGRVGKKTEPGPSPSHTHMYKTHFNKSSCTLIMVDLPPKFCFYNMFHRFFKKLFAKWIEGGRDWRQRKQIGHSCNSLGENNKTGSGNSLVAQVLGYGALSRTLVQSLVGGLRSTSHMVQPGEKNERNLTNLPKK